MNSCYRGIHISIIVNCYKVTTIRSKTELFAWTVISSVELKCKYYVKLL